MTKETKIKNGDSLVAELQDLIREMTRSLTEDIREAKKSKEDATDWLILSVRSDTTRQWLARLSEITGSAVRFLRDIDDE